LKNPLIFTHRKVALQSISDKVILGNTLYVAGSTTLDKLENAIDVFAMDYQALGDKNERAKRSRRGFGNAHLVLWYRNGIVYWWLFAKPETEGRHPIHAMENLRDALDKDQRIIVDDLELVRAPKIGTADSKWTWRMTDQKYQEWNKHIEQVVRSRSYPQMNNVFYLLWRYPGFSGVRKQIGYLVAAYKIEVKRASLKDPPKPPKKLYYLNRIKHTGISVKQLLAQTKAAS
jgi:hypothetical protein